MLVLLPAALINTRDSQHWGDDFSVYINQAINIAEGRAYDQSGFVYVDGFTPLPPAAPVGFSLLLVPIYKVFGFNMLAFCSLQAILFFLFGLLAFSFFRRHFALSVSLVCLLLAFYSNFMLWIKALVLSDILFSLLFLQIALFYKPDNLTTKRIFILIVLCIAAITTRSVGWIVIPAIWLYTLMVQVTEKKQGLPKREIIALTTTTLGIIAGQWFLSNYVFKSQFNFVQAATGVVEITKLPGVFLGNTTHYTNNYLSLFKSTASGLKVFGIIFSWLILLLTVTGLIYRLRYKRGFFDVLFLCYLLFIFCFPVISDYRYILPVHVFVITYLFTGIGFILSKTRVIRWQTLVHVAFALAVLISYADHLKYLITHGRETLPGPYEAISKETFLYLRNNVNEKDLIVFNKPRALTLYTGRRTTLPAWDKSADENYEKLRELGAKYYLINHYIVDEGYLELVNHGEGHFIETYRNWQYALYKDTTLTVANH